MTPFIQHVQNVAGAPGNWPDEFLAWYETAKWLSEERAAAVFLGQKFAEVERLRAQVEDLSHKADYWRRMHDEVRAAGITAAPAQQAAPEQTSGSSAAAPVVGPSLTVGAVLGEDQIEKAWRLGFRHACDAERLNADEEWGYKGANVIEEVQALNSEPVWPIAKLTVAEDGTVSASLYAPGLPDGDFDVFLEPVPAQPAAQAEPVAWVNRETLDWLAQGPEKMVGVGLSARKLGDHVVALYTSPPSKTAAQGVGDERAAFDAWWARYYGTEPMLVGWKVWQARAAIAQAPAAQGAHGPNDFNAAMLAQSASVTTQYTRAAQAPAAEPLTDEQAASLWPNVRFDICEGRDDVVAFARAIERAHGIGAAKEQFNG